MDKSFLFAGKGLSLDRLQNFCRVAEYGSLTKAAAGDPGRQSLYSRQIRELEQFFGVELKRRQGSGLIITEAGRRLAQLTRIHLAGLERFYHEAKKIPKRLSIGAGDSILEWMILPSICRLRRALPNTSLRFFSERSEAIVDRLIDMTLDLGVVREDALSAGLRRKSLPPFGYSLFLPAALSNGFSPKDRITWAKLPVATSMGGQFRETLDKAAAKAKWPLNIMISCSSFTQAAQAMRSRECGAVLPDIAATDSTLAHVAQIPLPFFANMRRKLCVVWNPRLAEVRPLIRSAVEPLVDAASS